jgi:glycosyltransferase involved in cell wall biosynthesis
VVGGSVTVLIASIPTRIRMLNRALVSVLNQMRMPDRIIVSIDHDRKGSAANRNQVLTTIDTDWVAFLDDDDEFLPQHLLTLLQNSDEADVIYAGCTVIGPHGEEIPDREEWGRFGKPFDGLLLRKKSYLPVTSLVRMELAVECSFTRPKDSAYDDWGFYLELLDKDARFLHVPQRTWIWHHHGTNTQGLPDRW